MLDIGLSRLRSIASNFSSPRAAADIIWEVIVTTSASAASNFDLVEEKLNAVSQMDMLVPYEQIIRQPIYNGLWDKCVNSFGISQRPSETSRDRSRDHCKIHRDAETVVLGFNIEPHKLWSLRLCVFYNGLWNGLWTSLTVSEKY